MTYSKNAWRLVVDGPLSGSSNMARDESMAMLCSPGDAPTLRAYKFEPPAVTVGRFQRLPGGIDLDACAAENVEVVRRATGGRAILHANDFTYSVVTRSAGQAVVDRRLYFDFISGAVLSALEFLGIKAEQVSHEQSKYEQGDWCFEGVLGIDLEWNGKKICGSAQRLFKGSVLQHGSLFLVGSEEMYQCISAEQDEPEPASRTFVTLSEAAGREIAWSETLEAFRSGFERLFGVKLEEGQLSTEEEELAQKLQIQKYAGEQWLLRPENWSAEFVIS